MFKRLCSPGNAPTSLSQRDWTHEPMRTLPAPLSLWPDSDLTKTSSPPTSVVCKTEQAFTSSFWSARSQLQAKVWYRPHILSLRAKEHQKENLTASRWRGGSWDLTSSVQKLHTPLLHVTPSVLLQPERALTVDALAQDSFREYVLKLLFGGQRAGRYSQRTGHQMTHPHLALDSSQNPISSVWQGSDGYIIPYSSKALSPGSIPSCRCLVLDLQREAPQASGI